MTASAEAPVAALEGVTHRYGERTALEDFGFEIRPGEVFGLLGPNGAGKTTAVRILCGLLQPTRGRALVAGHDVATAALDARRHLAFVPDGAPLYANLSARSHLRLVGRLHGLDEASIESTATRLLTGLGPARGARTTRSGSTPTACARRRPSPARSRRSRSCSCSTSRCRASTPRPPRWSSS